MTKQKLIMKYSTTHEFLGDYKGAAPGITFVVYDKTQLRPVLNAENPWIAAQAMKEFKGTIHVLKEYKSNATKVRDVIQSMVM